MDEAKVDRAIQVLLADYDRQDGSLSKSQVERVLEKRQLQIDECVEVYRQLESLGIGIEDDESSEEDDSTFHALAGEVSVSKDSSDAYESLETRLRGLKTKLLTAEEEVELARRIELGRRAESDLNEHPSSNDVRATMIERGKRARERMIVANLRLVLHIAKHYLALSDLSPDDLVQEGTIGLMRAVEKFDHTLGCKFSTYATWWIRQSITRALVNRGTTIRLPVHVYRDIYRLKRAARLLMQIRPDRRPRMHELVDELTWTADKVYFMQQVAALIPVSLDEQVPGHDDLALIDTLASEYESPEEHAERIELTRDIAQTLESVADRDREILGLRFGLHGNGQRLTLEEIGRRFGLTRERIRQIESKALQRIRQQLLRDPHHCLSIYQVEKQQ